MDDLAVQATKVQEIIDRWSPKPDLVIEMLHDIQIEFKYLPEQALKQICREVGVRMATLYHIATFFKAFSLQPKGRYCISVCLGTACQVEGGIKILEKFERELEITRGTTTNDLNFSLDEVHCLGCCGLAPVVTVNEEVYGKLALSKIPSVLKKYTKKTAGAEDAET